MSPRSSAPRTAARLAGGPGAPRRRKPLEGVRITDFTWIGAGAYTTKLLADAGADVLKIESRTYPDSLRNSPPFKDGVRGLERSGYFADRNTSKRSVALDLKHPRGRELALSLIAHSDIVANNFSPGVMERLGLGAGDVAAVNPQVIYLAMGMQGQTGPQRHFLGYGATMSALTGLHHLTAAPGGLPSGTGTNYPDHIPNPAHAAFAVLCALRHRRRTGRGQHIDVAQTEPMVALLADAVMQEAAGMPAAPCGNRHPLHAPQGVYPCRGEDRWIAITVRTDHEWQQFCEALALDVDLWALDADQRRARHDQLDAAIAGATRSHDPATLTQALQARGVVAGAVWNARDVVDYDPQLRHRGHWVMLDHPVMGPARYNAPPWRSSLHDTSLCAPAPLLGQHTDAVLRDVLGMDDGQISALRAEGVLA